MGLRVARDTLAGAEGLIGVDRMDDYGHPSTNFNRIADMWSAYLTEKLGATEETEEFEARSFTGVAHSFTARSGTTPARITASDVAAMMMLVKLSRVANDPGKLDSWVDLCGYSALGAEVSSGARTGGATWHE